jgi:hypothetical protein
MVTISCELQDIEEIMSSAGILLTGEAYDTAQDTYKSIALAILTYGYWDIRRLTYELRRGRHNTRSKVMGGGEYARRKANRG